MSQSQNIEIVLFFHPGFKLRKSIQPKQPLTILHELSGGAKPSFDFYDVPFEERERRAWQMDCCLDDVGCYECRCSVQGMEFIGEGDTKFSAKENVIEIAIQGIIAMKCDMNEEEEGVGHSEDHCPWPQIASLALYKLYNDWQSQGYQLPRELTAVEAAAVDGGQAADTSRHAGGVGLGKKKDEEKPPLQLLNEMASRMKLTLSYDLVSEVGMPNNKVFSYAVKILDKTYSGQAQSKKLAKQAAASAALSDRDTWYCPPVSHPPPPGDTEEGEEEDTVMMEHGDSVPPRKKRPAMDPEMKKLYFGDDRGQESKEVAPKTVYREPQDKGSQPGSHPSNK